MLLAQMKQKCTQMNLAFSVIIYINISTIPEKSQLPSCDFLTYFSTYKGSPGAFVI